MKLFFHCFARVILARYWRIIGQGVLFRRGALRAVIIASFVLVSAFPSFVFADQFEVADINEAENLFWKNVYPEGGWTLYCGEKFPPAHADTQMHALYSMSWVKSHLSCGDVDECRNNSARFNRIEADLHNYYPVMVMTGNARRDYFFGPVEDEYRDFFECNFEVDGGKKVVEPRNSALGNIARAILYMLQEYQLPLNDQQIHLLKSWNLQDPPSEDEKRRNNLIERLQGNRNVFIDDPDRANFLFN